MDVMRIIDFNKWEESIKKPTWYFDIVSDIQPFLKLKDENPSEWEVMKERVYDFFEEHLRKGDVVLGSEGRNWDAERLPIDSVVIHHTQMKPGLELDMLSAITLVRLYARYFADPYDARDSEVKGKPIYSGHFRNGKQVFWPYHWIVRKGGGSERLLYDEEIGWHAGKWDVNCRSVAIVLDNDYKDSIPPEEELDAIAEIVRKYYPHIKSNSVFGHREINSKTECPSNLFLSNTERIGWKDQLLNRIP